MALHLETGNARPLADPNARLDLWAMEEVYVQSFLQFCAHRVQADKRDFLQIVCLRASPFSLSSSQVLSSCSGFRAFSSFQKPQNCR